MRTLPDLSDLLLVELRDAFAAQEPAFRAYGKAAMDGGSDKKGEWIELAIHVTGDTNATGRRLGFLFDDSARGSLDIYDREPWDKTTDILRISSERVIRNPARIVETVLAITEAGRNGVSQLDKIRELWADLSLHSA